MVKASKIVSFLKKAIYFAFLILGCYFIHQGKVVERYLIERTDFSIYSEPMSELPTLSTYTLPYDRLLYGKDFNISYGVEGSIEKNLSFGTNKISKTLKVDFEQIYGMSVFKITPLNFSDNIPLDYKLTYYFEQSLILSNKQTLQVGIRVSTENNSIAISDQFRDGEEDELHLNIGSVMYIHQIRPEKYVYNKSVKKCRNIPYNELHLRKISKHIISCTNPCKPYGYGKYLNSILGKLPTCKNDIELKCFMDIKKKTEDVLIKHDALIRPCTKVQYSYKHLILKNLIGTAYSVPKNVAKFRLLLASPPWVTVNEEYVIYDTVAMIGAIGGTMGLCVGFSFMDCVGILFKLFEVGMDRINSKWFNNRAVIDQETNITWKGKTRTV